MKCLRCGNEDPHFFFGVNQKKYCRKCVSFRRIYVDETPTSTIDKTEVIDASYYLPFALTPYQNELSKRILATVLAHKNVLARAVCGAGKTELVYETISYYLKAGKKVCFAIARRQVVLELAKRFEKVFTSLKVIAVCEGFTKVINGDLIVCTTHQLYRYYHFFDLLILDEPDAFPFAGNEVLMNIACNSCRGEVIYLSATPDEYLLRLIEKGELVRFDLPLRPSNLPLPIPKIYYLPSLLVFVYLWRWLSQKKKQGRQGLIFVPTIALANRIVFVIKRYYKAAGITSKTNEKEKMIEEYRRKKLQFLVCTTVLERGVTFEAIDVLVLLAQHPVFNTSALIQIVGRVGRGIKDTSGEATLLSTGKTTSINQCIESIHLDNLLAFGAIKK